MFSVVPEAKLIYMLRNPIDRIVSQYIHRYASQKENRTIEEALAKLENNDYIQRSQYYFQLEQYLDFFADSQILIISSENLANFPIKTMKQVFQFLDVDANFEFQFKAKSMVDLVKLGPKIMNNKFKFDTRIHQASDKRRRIIHANSFWAKTISKLTDFFPNEIRYHLEKAIYYPFSRQIEPPQLNAILRQRILDYLAEDISKLKEYTGYSFKEWNLE